MKKHGAIFVQNRNLQKGYEVVIKVLIKVIIPMVWIFVREGNRIHLDVEKGDVIVGEVFDGNYEVDVMRVVNVHFVTENVGKVRISIIDVPKVLDV